jgi:DDE superfamily endonuclease
MRIQPSGSTKPRAQHVSVYGGPLAVGRRDPPVAWHNLRLVHLPIHASWLNQIEIYFSVVQRNVVSPNDFRDLAELQQRLLGFQQRYEQTAQPFEWRYTRADLDHLLRRLDHTDPLTQAA